MSPEGLSWDDHVPYTYMGRYEGDGIFTFAIQGTSDTLVIDVVKMTHDVDIDDEKCTPFTFHSDGITVLDEENRPFHPEMAAAYRKLHWFYWSAVVLDRIMED